ncbi:hypothetical protein H2198_005961 [Neophaeococcomyces mojaviensis]|uniref:Uncharacterized protein n=1 Tax=Neophaeococcomyces mojaviensis TaxID=3383035 RepID=A0ACC3A463_9EURO|nr:hypothetical protein H2198_005961 [Knufia sp. JES_112]
MTAPSSQTIVLITGTNRGVGRALAETYLARPAHTLVALVRNPNSETSQSILSYSAASGSRAILVPYNAEDTSSASTAISTLATQHPQIAHLDLVIANAGSNTHMGPSLAVDAKTYLTHYTINALAPLLLFSATIPLMQKAFSPKFFALSSATGSLQLMNSSNMRFDRSGKPRGGALPYTSAKCALNHLIMKLDIEYPDIVVGLFTPGPTKTGFTGGRVNWDLVLNAIEVGPVAEGLISQFDDFVKATGEEGNTFVLRDWKGDIIPW